MIDRESLIQKLFANECSKAELNLLFELIQKDIDGTAPEVMTALLRQMEKVPPLDTITSKSIQQKVWKDTIEKEATLDDGERGLASRSRSIWIRSAAAALLLMTASWFVFQYVNPTQVIVQTQFGEHQSIQLPDGSKVTLNANSKLSFEKDWTDPDSRMLSLQGEAYFEVEKRPGDNARFRVFTKDLTVEVLGTIFNVNTRKETTKVYLEEGKVKLNLGDGKSSEWHLEPGEVASYSAKKKILIHPEKARDELVEVSWKDGFVTYEDRPLQEILEELAATNDFGFEIKTAGLAAREWNLTVPNNDIVEAMSLLGGVTGAEITKVGNKYIFEEKTE